MDILLCCVCPVRGSRRKGLGASIEYPINVYQSAYSDNIVKLNTKISELSHTYSWPDLIEELTKFQFMINTCKFATENSEPSSLFTPLHEAANGKAPKEVFEKLLKLGASKSLKTSEGETAHGIAKRLGMSEDILKLTEEPKEVTKHYEEIQNMERGLHEVIKERVEDLIVQNGQSLPQLAYLYEFCGFHYPVPGMYGGFSVTKHKRGIQVSSFIRICGGSGQRHVIDRTGKVTLEAEGFY